MSAISDGDVAGCGAKECTTCGERHHYVPFKAWLKDGVAKTSNPTCHSCELGRYENLNGHMSLTCGSCPSGQFSSCAWHARVTPAFVALGNPDGSISPSAAQQSRIDAGDVAGCGAMECTDCGERHYHQPLKAWLKDGVAKTSNPTCRACHDALYQDENDHMHTACKACTSGQAQCAWTPRATSCGALSCS
jgi:hypothetical protein